MFFHAGFLCIHVGLWHKDCGDQLVLVIGNKKIIFFMGILLIIKPDFDRSGESMMSFSLKLIF